MQKTNQHLAFLLAFLISSCVIEDPSDLPLQQSELETEQYAVIHASILADRSNSLSEAAISMKAHFMAFTGLELEALLYGLNLWIPNQTHGCHVLTAPTSQTSSTISVQLLDAGSIGLSSQLSLLPRSVPSYLPHFHGVVYSTEVLELVSLQEELTSIWASGGRDINAFTVELDPPPAIQISRVNQITVGAESSITVSSAQNLDLSFTTQSSEVYVQITSTNHASIQCLVDANSQLSFEQNDISEIFGQNTSLIIQARTAHYTSIPQSVGIDGSVIFDYIDRLEILRP